MSWTETLARRAAGDDPGFHGTDVPQEKRDDDRPLDELSKAQLLERAQAAGLDVTDKMTKAQLVDALTGA